jgi:hypothetical protein
MEVTLLFGKYLSFLIGVPNIVDKNLLLQMEAYCAV